MQSPHRKTRWALIPGPSYCHINPHWHFPISIPRLNQHTTYLSSKTSEMSDSHYISHANCSGLALSVIAPLWSRLLSTNCRKDYTLNFKDKLTSCVFLCFTISDYPSLLRFGTRINCSSWISVQEMIWGFSEFYSTTTMRPPFVIFCVLLTY